MNIHPLNVKYHVGKSYGSALVILVTAVTALTACGDKPENPPVSNVATNTQKDVPMSAKPADIKEKPIAVGEEGKISNGEVVTHVNPPASAQTATNNVITVTGDSSTDATAEGVADNSGMDKISENDQVIDDAPASPDAPKAQEENSEISNQPTGHKKK